MSYSINNAIRKIENLQKRTEKIGLTPTNSPPNSGGPGDDKPTPDEFIGIPFWLWDISSNTHRQLAKDNKKRCCFNHLIGLPHRDNKNSPIFPWQRDIIDAYERHKYNWILKATGLGLTELTLRYILWKCVSSYQWKNAWIPIITGPRIDIAKDAISRMKDMMQGKYQLYDVTLEYFIINRVKVRAFPSNHLEAFRGLPSVKLIFLDEADFFRKIEQNDVRDTSERYIAKSDTQILMVSTPNRPGGLMQRIEEERNSIYNKIRLPYTIGIGTMYTQEQIDEAKKSPSFEREYNLKYLGEIGNIFNIQDIEYSERVLGLQYNPNDQPTYPQMIPTYLGVDPGFGSSMFGLSVVRLSHDGLGNVLYSEEISRGSIKECFDTVLRLAQQYRVMKIYIDASAAGFITDLKISYGENRNYAKVMKDSPGIVDTWITAEEPRVVPVPFGSPNKHGVRYHEYMLRNLEIYLQKKVLRINPVFTKLLIALRTATAKQEKYTLDKERTSHDDLLDALMLSLLGFYGH